MDMAITSAQRKYTQERYFFLKKYKINDFRKENTSVLNDNMKEKKIKIKLIMIIVMELKSLLLHI